MKMKDKLFLGEAHLKGFKSILDAKVSFKPGLNIIIGRNGSGKTNFISFLHYLLNFEIENLSKLRAELYLNKENQNLKITYNNKSENENNITKLVQEVQFNGKSIERVKAQSELLYREFNFVENLITYQLPQNLPIISTSVKFEEVLETGQNHIIKFQKLLFETDSLFLKDISIHFYLLPNEINRDQIDNKIRTVVNDYLSKLEKISEQYSSIEKIRLNPDFDVQLNENRLIIKEFSFEYFSNKSWNSFDKLSDGTKRIIYIISELLSFSNFGWGKGFYYKSDDRPPKITFLEEPELGIHPHQLHLLMNFIKEEAENKQIIITTHSPQVLNVLSKDELDRILICEWTPKEGTQLRNMTEKEMQDAHVYMDEVGNLSDYWLHSDFNRI